MKHVNTQQALKGWRHKVGALSRSMAFATMVPVLGLVLVPQMAQASDEVIWGRQSGLGAFSTDKVNLTAPATITHVTYDGAGGPGFCIWSQQPYPEVFICWNVGDPSLIGTVLPTDRGYFAIPAKRTPNTPSYVHILVDY